MNLIPVASEMSNWLQQKGQLSLLTEREQGHQLSCTNPYAYSSTSLAAQLGLVINQVFEFGHGQETLDPITAELQRIRLEGELVLMFSRFCEAAIKQMLYCTDLREGLYKRASMGRLLSFDCGPCRKGGHPHQVSLLGALAHHYYLCPMLEGCLFDHLSFVGNLRTKKSAHSDSSTPRYTFVEESREAARQSLDDVGHELGHLCEHLGQIEGKMAAEIGLNIGHFPDQPPFESLLRVPVRVRDLGRQED